MRREDASKNSEISIVLCDDDFIQELNRTHRDKNKPTDVLSFPQDDDIVLGDIVISLPTAERQARAAGWAMEDEVVLLAVHGVLHLLGYDDETASEAARMRDISSEVLTAVGVALPPGAKHPYFVDYD
ncbi:MAG: rRNA maturation RNase YbeY [Capsulimonas sp.]|uniref:rRNA maturation RNase YbeY n=1 Tax=Capsulimonas sp. TaxID=2494211 RepID=UPI003265F239